MTALSRSVSHQSSSHRGLSETHHRTVVQVPTRNSNAIAPISSSSYSLFSLISSHCRCKTGRLWSVLLLGGLGWFLVLMNLLVGPQQYNYRPNFTIIHYDTNNNKNLTPQQQQEQPRRRQHSSLPTHHACDGYQGIYHIQQGDIGGAAGTIFFQFVIGQIIWAERYHFKPWVYLNNVSYIVYDNRVHGRVEDSVEFDMMAGASIEYVRRANGVAKDVVPGAPIFDTTTTTTSNSSSNHLYPHHFSFVGNGVWESYFEPISDFVPGDQSCIHKPLLTMDMYLISPGIHGFADWAPKCWRYDYMPDYVTLPHLPYQEWLQPQRQQAHDIMTRYIRFKPYLHEMAHQVNPIISSSSSASTVGTDKSKCCGVHIRHSDKVGGRRKVPMDEFLPYLQAYVNAGGTCIYLATDSSHVLNTAQSSWPHSIRTILRSLGPHVIRSHNETAVFDMTTNHHQTNTEILVEILALSKCEFLVHGFSAVSETAIWMQYPKLHDQSVNLEDPDHRTVAEFEALVHAVLRGQSPPPPRRVYQEWWKQSFRTLPSGTRTRSNSDSSSSHTRIQHKPCSHHLQHYYQGILHIAHAGNKAAAGTAFFTTILNQLLYADQHRLLPWIHLQGSTSRLIYDVNTHNNNNNNNATITFRMRRGVISISPFSNAIDDNGNIMMDPNNSSCPGKPVVDPTTNNSNTVSVQVKGDGIWNHYFQPVSDFTPPDEESLSSCFSHLPLYQLSPAMVMPGLYSDCPGSIRAWRYDQVPASQWYDHKNNSAQTLSEWLYPMRRQAHLLVKKYYKFQPHIIAKARRINPIKKRKLEKGEQLDFGQKPKNVSSCLAVHIRQSDKEGLYRRKFPPHKFRDYMRAYVKAGGKAIFVATDSHRALEYIANHFPPDILQVMRTQGKYVVRSTKKWPVFELADHHRTNSEALVDALAMSYCNIILHGNSALSEAAIYLNLQLHHRSVNLEHPNAMSVAEFESLSRSVLGTESAEAQGTSVSDREESGDMGITSHSRFQYVNDGANRLIVDDANGESDSVVTTQHVANTTVLSRRARQCRKNAIVYLAQKRHSSYNRDSYGLLLQSLDLLTKNYLANHSENTDLFIFHTGDFDKQDLHALGKAFFGNTRLLDMLRLVDLSNSKYWRRPPWHLHDNPVDWYAIHLFSEGYRHMMHWFAIGIWDFFDAYNQETGCNYRMIMRLDEDSFIHSPIQYNVFDFMRNHGYVYGYRLCAYELQVTQRMWKVYKTSRRFAPPVRDVELEMCGFYNNFFVASLDFFRSKEVQSFLKLADRNGYIYRRRLGDLMIHSMVVYAFAPRESIHRFLDFTYEHSTVNHTTGCIVWGGIQAGYLDDRANQTLTDFYYNRVVKPGCEANVTAMSPKDLSPSYNHLPNAFENAFTLTTIMAGNVELPQQGILSG